jgi:hypothetical protein
MDNIVFYQTPSASSSQPLRLLGALTSSIVSRASIASLSVRQTASQLCRENLTATRNSLNSDNDDDLPNIDELFLGIMQNISASADPNSNDGDGFVDIDELLSSMKQESISASAKPNSSGIAEKVDNRTRGSSPADSSRSTEGSSQGEHASFLNLAKTSYSYGPRSDYTKRRRIYRR